MVENKRKEAGDDHSKKLAESYGSGAFVAHLS